MLVRGSVRPASRVRASAMTESRHWRHAVSKLIPKAFDAAWSRKNGIGCVLEISTNLGMLSGPRVSARYWKSSDPNAYAPLPLGHWGLDRLSWSRRGRSLSAAAAAAIVRWAV